MGFQARHCTKIKFTRRVPTLKEITVTQGTATRPQAPEVPVLLCPSLTLPLWFPTFSTRHSSGHRQAPGGTAGLHGRILRWPAASQPQHADSAGAGMVLLSSRAGRIPQGGHSTGHQVSTAASAGTSGGWEGLRGWAEAAPDVHSHRCPLDSHNRPPAAFLQAQGHLLLEEAKARAVPNPSQEPKHLEPVGPCVKLGSWKDPTQCPTSHPAQPRNLGYLARI